MYIAYNEIGEACSCSTDGINFTKMGDASCENFSTVTYLDETCLKKKGENKMKDTVKTIVEHPFASILVIGAIARGVATIVCSAKGTPINPLITVTKNASAVPKQ